MNEVMKSVSIDIMDNLLQVHDEMACNWYEIETQKVIFYMQQKDAEDELGGKTDV